MIHILFVIVFFNLPVWSRDVHKSKSWKFWDHVLILQFHQLASMWKHCCVVVVSVTSQVSQLTGIVANVVFGQSKLLTHLFLATQTFYALTGYTKWRSGSNVVRGPWLWHLRFRDLLKFYVSPSSLKCLWLNKMTKHHHSVTVVWGQVPLQKGRKLVWKPPQYWHAKNRTHGDCS